MYKHVLLLLLFLILISGVVFGPASADYLNDSWIRERSEAFLDGDDRTVPVGDQLRVMLKRLLPDSANVDPETMTIGVRPPVDIAKPPISESDSVDSENHAVVRTREIRGLRLDRYHAIPIEEYATTRLDENLLRTWRDNKSRVPNWSASDETSGGVANLDFALPVGKRFEHLVGGKARLDINGSQTITFSGKSEYDEGTIATSMSKNSSFPSLSMKQEPQFSIRGSVGERITVDIKQESSDGFGFGGSLEDNMSIKYKGEANDIIQSVEAGNTSLNLEGAQFAGYSGSHKGLFGIRTEGRVGPLAFTAIASQEKSEANKKTYKGAAEESTTKIHDYEYKANTYFFLDLFYQNQFAVSRTSLDQIVCFKEDSVMTLFVYEDDGNTNNNDVEATYAYRAIATPMIMDGQNTIADTTGIPGYFHLLKPGTDYSVDRNLGYIVFRNRVSDTSAIAIYMQTRDGRTYGDLTYDASDTKSRMKLKLIKKASQGSSDADTWALEWKNVYDLGQSNIEEDGLEINIYRESSEGADASAQDGIPLIRILGLDQQDELGGSTPDNKVDLNRSFVNLSRGELIFPLLHPFDSAPPKGTTLPDLNPKVPTIYTASTAEDRSEATKYYIQVKTSSRQATIRIDTAGGITEGTEKITLDGRTLTRGTDYTISYMTGEVTLLADDALSPTANLEITYEEVNALSSTQKSLMGLRTQYDFWGNSHIGGVFLYNNESTTEERVKLGQEPSRTILFDTDASVNFDAPLLTSAVDKLPFVIADQKSTVRFDGELARSVPNMNTKGEVYIDDFEGTQNTTMSNTRTNWTTGSPPDPATMGGWPMTRGQLQWYNPWEQIASTAIWPNKETSTEDNTVNVLNLVYGKAPGVNPDQSYAAVMTPFYRSGVNLSRARYLEIWAKGSKGTLKVDLGSISEDWFPLEDPNGELDTEDRPLTVTGTGDGLLAEDEDTGLDGKFDRAEDGYGTGNPDPAGDDFRYDKNDYSYLNGTEGNMNDGDRAHTPDTEDINGNSNLDEENSYYEYRIDLSDPNDQYFVPDTAPNGIIGWRMFRIPLWDNSEAMVGGNGAPDSTLIKYARLIVTGCDTTLIQIARMEVVENTWLEDGIVDSTGTDIPAAANDEMRITRSNTDENSILDENDEYKRDENGNIIGYYPPPGVSKEVDKSTGVRKMEQSLVIETEDLAPGNTAFAYRSFSTKMDFTNYTSLKMFVHGPDDMPTTDNIELVFRFGADRENYYEYRTPVYGEWNSANDVEAVFATCTALKLKRTAVDSTTGAYEETVGSKTYGIRGSPSLQNIKLISIGIRNRSTSTALTTQLWLDELRMDNLRDMTGWAARASVDANLAGFASVIAKVEHRTADFHGMNSTTGSGADATSWNVNTAVNLDRFAPKRWNLQLPVKVDMNQSTSLPRLKSGSDIILSDDQKDEYSSGSFGQSYSISYRKNADSSQKGLTKHLLSWGLEKWNASYTWGEDTGHTPLSGSTADRRSQGQFTYNVNPRGRSISLFSWAEQKHPGLAKRLEKLKLGYTPNQLSYDLTYSDNFSLDDETLLGGVADTTKSRVMTERINFGYDPLTNVLKYQYTQNKTRDIYMKRETNYGETQRLTLAGPRFGYITNNYNYDVSYTEQNNPRYSLSSQLGGREIDFQKRFSADASLEWGKLLEDLGTSRPASASPRNEKPRRDGPGAPSPNEADPPKPEKAAHSGLRQKVFRAISKAVSPLSFRYSKNNSVSAAGISNRPDMSTRLGFGEIEPPDASSVVTLENAESNGSEVSLETSVKLPLSMGLSTSMDMSDRNSSSSSSRSRSEEITVPDLDFSWNNVDGKLPFLKKYMKNISITSRYSVKNETTWENENVHPTSDKNTRNHSPLISLNGIILDGIQSSFSVSMSSETSTSLSGETASTTVYDKLDASATFRYTVSSSNLLKRLKIKSNIDLETSLGTSRSERRRSTSGSVMETTAKNSSWSVAPKANYRFSQKFTGSASVTVQNSKDMANTVHKVREVSISGKMTF